MQIKLNKKAKEIAIRENIANDGIENVENEDSGAWTLKSVRSLFVSYAEINYRTEYVKINVGAVGADNRLQLRT
jgi:hypothetical protein